MKTISQLIYQRSTGWVTAGALLIFVLFTALVLPGQAAMAAEASGGASSPDTSFFYRPADLYAFAESAGASGRSAYIHSRWTFDVVWPLVYTLFLLTHISWGFAAVLPAGSLWRLLNLLPVAAMAFDFFENTATSVVMARYPAASPLAAAIAPFFTSTKWLLIAVCFALLAGALVLRLVFALRSKNKLPKP